MSVLIPSAASREGNEPIFALNAEARRRAEAGESILNATLGVLTLDDGSLAVMDSVAEAFHEVPMRLAAAYAPISGPPGFLAAVEHDLFGGGELAGQVVSVATPGSTGAIYQAIVNFLEPGHAALTPSFYWGPYRVIAEHVGRRVDVFPMFTPEMRFDLDAFAAGLDRTLSAQGRALILFNFPCNNPTGYSLDREEWRAVGEIVREAGRKAPVAFFLDHAYAHFGGPGSGGWLDAAPDMLESSTLMVGWTVSKSFTQYGARVGALVALHRAPEERARIADAVGYTCRATWSNCNHRGMIAAQALLTDPVLKARADAEREDLITLLGRRVDAFNAASERAGVRHPRYEGGFFTTVLTPDAEVTAAAMRDRGVYVVPMEGAVRVAICSTPLAAVPRLVEALGAGLAAAEG
ncbi:MAG: aminotransferase class I/II-fold pyridoxal phosphate-dependent enzyme [Gemmatimonadota bacterium]|nr:aminotransferase class I/II-fold pyridoxal phosphate-dependent enzyme [Gemmatimonadota bacterium]MDH5759447.1 aminotransferase class I/II-fold pyridoxal phosphate-dependent enzyme [Gemmatimonadota bacterium]